MALTPQRIKALLADALAPATPPNVRAAAQQELDAFAKQAAEAPASCAWLLANDRADDALVFFALQVLHDRLEHVPDRAGLRVLLLQVCESDPRPAVERKAALVLVKMAMRDWLTDAWVEFSDQVCALAWSRRRFALMQAACESMYGVSKLLDGKLHAVAFAWTACLKEVLKNNPAPDAAVLQTLFALLEWAPLESCYSDELLASLFGIAQATQLVQGGRSSQLACLAVASLSQIVRRKYVPPQAQAFVLQLGAHTMALLVHLNKSTLDDDLAAYMTEFVACFITEHVARIEAYGDAFAMDVLLSQFFEFTMALRSATPLLRAVEVWETYVSHVDDVESAQPGGHPFARHLGALVLSLVDLFLLSKDRGALVDALEASTDVCGDDEDDCDLFTLLDHVAALARRVASLSHSAVLCAEPVLNRLYPGLLVCLAVVRRDGGDAAAWDVCVHLVVIASVAHVFALDALVRDTTNGAVCLELAGHCVHVYDAAAARDKSARQLAAKAAALTCLAGLTPWAVAANAADVQAKSLELACRALTAASAPPRMCKAALEVIARAEAPAVLQCCDARALATAGALPSHTRTALVRVLAAKLLSLRPATLSDDDVRARLAAVAQARARCDVAAVAGIVQAAGDDAKAVAVVYDALASGPLEALLEAVGVAAAQPSASPVRLADALDCLGAVVAATRRRMGDQACAQVAQRLLEALRSASALNGEALASALRVLQAMAAEPSDALNALLQPMFELVLGHLLPQARGTGVAADAIALVATLLTVHWKWFLAGGGNVPSQVRAKDLDPARRPVFLACLGVLVESLDLASAPVDVQAALAALVALDEKHRLFSQAFAREAREAAAQRLVALLRSRERDLLHDDAVHALYLMAVSDWGWFCASVGWTAQPDSEQAFAKALVAAV